MKFKEQKLLASIQLLNQHLQNLSSGWPIQVELLDPKGIVVEKYSTALVDENARYDYVLPAHAQRGSWSLKVTELIQQKTFVSKVELK